MAAQERKEGLVDSPDIVNAHKDNNVFFDKLNAKIAEKWNIKRQFVDILNSGIEATETVKSGSMKEAFKNIEKIQIEKQELENKDKIQDDENSL